MRRLFVIVSLMALGCFVLSAEAAAKGGRGGGGNRGGKGRAKHHHGGGPRGGKGTFSHSRHERTHVKHSGRDFGHPRDKQMLVEQRKLEHRRQVAKHLRELSERNGNEQLKEVANRMDAKAQEHFEKRIRKLTGEDPLEESLEEVGELDDLAGRERVGDFEDLAEETQEAVRKLTGRENALYRQLRNEERKLAHRMEAVERLRRLGELEGDEALLHAADRLEETALDHYMRRMEKISEFQERFGLP